MYGLSSWRGKRGKGREGKGRAGLHGDDVAVFRGSLVPFQVGYPRSATPRIRAYSGCLNYIQHCLYRQQLSPELTIAQNGRTAADCC